MPETKPPPPGWSVRASGNAASPTLISLLGGRLAELLGREVFGKIKAAFDHSSDGWVLEAHGATEDSVQHSRLLHELTGLLGSPSAQTGSSEFTSPFCSGVNFHGTSDGQETIETPPQGGYGGYGTAAE